MYGSYKTTDDLYVFILPGRCFIYSSISVLISFSLKYSVMPQAIVFATYLFLILLAILSKFQKVSVGYTRKHDASISGIASQYS